METRFPALGLLAGLIVMVPMAAAQRLAETSPFLPPARGEAAVVTENAPLELRGTMGSGEGRMYNIYNPTTKMSAWVGLNEEGHAFQVRSFDESAETVSLNYGGRTVVLKMTQARIAPLVEARPNQSGPGPNIVQPPGLLRQPTPEQQRQLENVAAEVERRRQMRNQLTRPQGPQDQQKN